MTFALDETVAVARLAVCLVSSSVFQASHAGHWPCHFAVAAPQSRQTKLSLALAIVFPFKSYIYVPYLVHYIRPVAVESVSRHF